MHVNRVKECMDLLDTFSAIPTSEHHALAWSVIEVLHEYPEPCPKSAGANAAPVSPQLLGAYVNVCNVHSAMHRFTQGLKPAKPAFAEAQTELEHALTLLLELTSNISKPCVDRHINQVKDCMDLLATLPAVSSSERVDLALSVIDCMGGYPKPVPKGAGANAPKPMPQLLGAYIHVNNARSALRLFTLGYKTSKEAFTAAQNGLECALSLLLELNAKEG